jgi:hypothetical protein
MRHACLIILVVSVMATTAGAQESSRFRYSPDPFSEDDARTERSGEERNEGNLGDGGLESNEQENKSYQAHEAGDYMTPVQRIAYVKADQRRQRIAARKWFGLSNSRPIANSNPYFSAYSPAWVGSYWQPYHWYGDTIWR